MLVDPLGSRYPTAASLPQFYQQVEQRDQARARRPRCGLGQHAAAGPVLRGQTRPSRSSAILRSTRANVRLADHQIVSPGYFDTLDLPIVTGRRFNDRDTARQRRPSASSTRPSCAAPSRTDRRSACGSRSGPAERRRRRRRPRDRRRRAPGERPARRDSGIFAQVYVPMAQDLSDDIFLRRAAGLSGRDRARGLRARGHRARRQRPAGERQERHDARRHRVRRHVAASVPGRAGDDVRRLALTSGDGRRVRRPRLFRPAARARVRRCAARWARRPATCSASSSASAAPVIAAGVVIGLALAAILEPPADDHALRRAATRPGDVRGCDDRARRSPCSWRSPVRRGARSRIDPAVALRGE